MVIREVTINNQVGLHARPATFFIQKANEFKSSIWIEKDERRVNAKSLLGVLSLGIVKGTSVNIIADGSDEEEAVDMLAELIDCGFENDDAVVRNGKGVFSHFLFFVCALVCVPWTKLLSFVKNPISFRCCRAFTS